MINRCTAAFLLIASGCFLFERPFTPVGTVSIETAVANRSQDDNIVFQQDVEAVTKITDRVAKAYRFSDVTQPFSDVFIRYYGKQYERGGGTIFVFHQSEENLIRISVCADYGSFNSELVRIAEELGRELQTEFGEKRATVWADVGLDTGSATE